MRIKGATTVLTGAIADANGAFRIQGLRPGVYSLRITYIGFSPNVQDVTLTPAAPHGEPRQREAHPGRGESSGGRGHRRARGDDGRARPQLVSRQGRRAGRGNASEVLDNVPSVNVDADGKVSLRGNENVAIQINGRPTPIRGTQLGAYLKSSPRRTSSTASRSIPNPSAKYDPEGMAGIINIVLKQNVDLGLSAGLNVGVLDSRRYNGSGNVGYQGGKLTTFSNLGIISDSRHVVGINDRERYDALQRSVGHESGHRQPRRQQRPELRHQRRLQADAARRALECADAQSSHRERQFDQCLLGAQRPARCSIATIVRATEREGLDDRLRRRRSSARSSRASTSCLAELRFNRSHDQD